MAGFRLTNQSRVKPTELLHHVFKLRDVEEARFVGVVLLEVNLVLLDLLPRELRELRVCQRAKAGEVGVLIESATGGQRGIDEARRAIGAQAPDS